MKNQMHFAALHHGARCLVGTGGRGERGLHGVVVVVVAVAVVVVCG